MDKRGKLIAYLNIVHLQIMLDNHFKQVEGIGNVCVDKNLSGQGIGLLLMQICNYCTRGLGNEAILLCKKELVKFYEKCGWFGFYGHVLLDRKEYFESVMFNKLHQEKELIINKYF